MEDAKGDNINPHDDPSLCIDAECIVVLVNAVDKLFHSARNNGVSSENLGKALDILGSQISSSDACCGNFDISYTGAEPLASPNT